MSYDSRKALTRPPVTRYSDLPVDFLKLVVEVFTANFDSFLKKLKEQKPSTRFTASGRIYGDEIILCLTVGFKGELGSTTLRASIDYDKQASHPAVPDLLNSAVDALGHSLTDLSQTIEPWFESSLSNFESAPYEWTAVEVENRKVFIKIDKTNPDLDKMTEDWLKKNDPQYKKNLEKEHEEVEALFVTGRPDPNKPVH